jgi:hypothetical protein
MEERESRVCKSIDCPIMEECQYVDWLRDDKNVLAAALREIYGTRGEDKEIADIINKALEVD